jgi:hypothetical protein
MCKLRVFHLRLRPKKLRLRENNSTPLKVSKRPRDVQKVHHVVHKINPARANLKGPIYHALAVSIVIGLMMIDEYVHCMSDGMLICIREIVYENEDPS